LDVDILCGEKASKNDVLSKRRGKKVGSMYVHCKTHFQLGCSTHASLVWDPM